MLATLFSGLTGSRVRRTFPGPLVFIFGRGAFLKVFRIASRRFMFPCIMTSRRHLATRTTTDVPREYYGLTNVGIRQTLFDNRKKTQTLALLCVSQMKNSFLCRRRGDESQTVFAF